MLYEEYRLKMAKVADFLGILRRFRILIISVCALIVATTVTLLSVSGTVYDKEGCPESITAGEALPYAAGAVFNSVQYEFCAENSDVWQAEQPVRPGSYLVRSVSKDIAGKPRYGKTHSFAVLPKPVDVTVDQAEITYGGIPAVKADLLLKDEIYCTAFEYDDYSAKKTNVKAVKESIRAFDADGNDVSASYIFNPVESEIAFEPREVTFTVTPYTAEYDGKSHPKIPYTGYSVSENTPLAENDSEEVYVKFFETQVGEYSNVLEFKIFKRVNGKEYDVTDNYRFNVVTGSLTVTKRTLKITTADAEKVYDGEGLYSEAYTLDEATEAYLQESGHRLEVVGHKSIINAESVENELQFAVFDGDGEDVTDNYVFDTELGLLNIKKRPITVKTDGASWFYDGETHSDNTGFLVLRNENSNYATDDEIAYFVEGSEMRVTTVADSCKNKLKIGVKKVTEEGETDVTDNYIITYEYGDIVVLPRPINVKVTEVSWVYDGKPHSSGAHVITPAEELIEEKVKNGAEAEEVRAVVEGHTPTARGLRTITNVGRVKNGIDFGIFDGDGNPVTDNYKVQYDNGDLIVTHREIDVRALGYEGYYDGKAHSRSEVEVSSANGLADGHSIAADTEGVIVNVGEKSNSVTDGTVIISDADGNNVTENYKILNLYDGKLVVKKRPVTITAGSDKRVYNGTALTSDKYAITYDTEILDFGIVEGQNYSITCEGSQLDVGKSDNIITAVEISLQNGEPATDNYDITLKVGTLEVTKRYVKIIADSADDWVYSGVARSLKTFTVVTEYEDSENCGLVDTHYPFVTDFEEFTDAGTHTNLLSFGINDGEGNPVTDNYDIDACAGEIKIKQYSLKLVTLGKTFVYDGSAQSYDGWDYAEGYSLALESHSLQVVKGSCTQITNVNSETVYNDMKFTVKCGEDDVTANYAIEVIPEGELIMTAREITIETLDGEWVYDGRAHGITDLEDKYKLVSGSVALDSHEFVYHDYTTITNVRREGEEVIYNDTDITVMCGEDDITYNYDINVVPKGVLNITRRKITFTTRSSTWKYDGEWHTDNMLLDIYGPLYDAPFRHLLHYKEDELPKIKDVGEVQNKYELYVLEGNKDVTYNYYFGEECVYGTLTIEALPITVTARGAKKYYDGEKLSGKIYYGALNEKDFTVTSDFETEFEKVNKNHTFEAETAGEIVNAYDSPVKTSVIKGSVVICDADGVNVNGNFDISYAEEELTVLKRPITVTANDGEQWYNGVALTEAGWKVAPNNSALEEGFANLEFDLVAGHTLTAITSGSRTDAGTGQNTIVEGSVVIKNGDEDVTANYDIACEKGTLTVKKRKITVYTKDDTKVYNGKALTWKDEETLINVHFTVELFSEVNDGFAPLVAGHKVILSFTGEQLNVGESDNTVDNLLTEILCADGQYPLVEGESITDNYDVSYGEWGTLKVTERGITVTTLSDLDKIYDGTAQRFFGFIISGEYGLAENHEAEADEEKTYSTVTNVSEGEVVNEFSVVIKNGDEDVTANYDINYACTGKIKINARPITVSAADCEKIYDGKIEVLAEDRRFSDAYTGDKDKFGIVVGHVIHAEIEGYNDTIGADVRYDENGNVTGYKIKITDGTVEIYDKDNNLVSGNYDVTVAYDDATLKVLPRDIVVRTGDKTWTYDGNEHFHEYAEASGMPLVTGHDFVYISNTKVTDVKRDESGNVTYYENELEVGITDGNRDVTLNYNIADYVYGKLTINPLTVTIATKDDTKPYDGEALKNAGFTFNTLVEGHTGTVEVTGERTDAGESPNTVNEESVAVTCDGKDVTGNYKFEYKTGTLTVTQRYVKIITEDKTFYYNGTAQHWEYYRVETEYGEEKAGLLDGHFESPTGFTTITDVGTAPNEMEFLILSADGETDYTANYNIDVECGTLEVKPAEITLTSGSAEKPYDGTPLTCGIVDVDGALVPEHQVICDVTGMQTEVGSSKNTFTFLIVNEAGDDVSANYEVTAVLGTLTVTEAEPDELENFTVFKIKSDKSGYVYLRNLSYANLGYDESGNFVGGFRWSSAKKYGETFTYEGAEYSYNYLTSIALQNAGYQSSHMEIDEMTGTYYFLPYYLALPGGSYKIQTSDVLYSGSDMAFSVDYMNYDYLKDGAVNANPGGELAGLEEAYRQFVRENYLFVDDETRAFLEGIIEQYRFGGDNVIEDVANYVMGSAKYELHYDYTELERQPHPVIDFLRDYDVGVCRHYAMAATMLYRTLGIPARYTSGFLGRAVAGEWTDVKASSSHGWVEIYLDGLGWVMIEVTPPSSGGGSGEGGEVLPIVIKPKDAYKEYDGTALVATEIAPNLQLNTLIDAGYDYKVTFGGSQTDVGRSESTITSFVLYDPNGRISNGFTFEYEKGILEVRSDKVVTVHTFALSSVYDGTMQYFGANQWYATAPDGYRVEVTGLQNVGMTDAGVLSNSALESKLTVTVYDENGIDVTGGVYINYDADFTIFQRKITVTSKSVKKVYDGTELKTEEIDPPTGEGLAEGDTATVSKYVTLVDVGEIENVIRVRILNRNGEDVTNTNYVINYIYGTLTVTE